MPQHGRSIETNTYSAFTKNWAQNSPAARQKMRENHPYDFLASLNFQPVKKEYNCDMLNTQQNSQTAGFSRRLVFFSFKYCMLKRVCVCVCVLKLHVEMCVLKLYLKCACWNCTRNRLETSKLENKFFERKFKICWKIEKKIVKKNA